MCMCVHVWCMYACVWSTVGRRAPGCISDCETYHPLHLEDFLKTDCCTPFYCFWLSRSKVELKNLYFYKFLDNAYVAEPSAPSATVWELVTQPVRLHFYVWKQRISCSRDKEIIPGSMKLNLQLMVLCFNVPMLLILVDISFDFNFTYIIFSLSNLSK
jgi:hypothetical protein